MLLCAIPFSGPTLCAIRVSELLASCGQLGKKVAGAHFPISGGFILLAVQQLAEGSAKYHDWMLDGAATQALGLELVS